MTLFEYHLVVHCESTFGVAKTFSIGQVTTGSTSAYQYIPSTLVVAPGTSDPVLEVFFDLEAQDPIVVVGFIDSRQYILEFTGFDACPVGTA